MKTTMDTTAASAAPAGRLHGAAAAAATPTHASTPSPAVARPPAAGSAGRLYPQRIEDPVRPVDDWLRATAAGIRQRLPGRAGWLHRLAAQAMRQREAVAMLDDAELRAALQPHARDVWAHGARAAGFASGLALVAEAARRSLGLDPFATQLMGAACVAGGRLAEMQTGEGKTLTAGLAAALVASAGVPVHVATVNDYLAQRDADELRPLFAFLGLTVGTVIGGLSLCDRRAAYACSIAYCTGKELVFDYLKDSAASGADADRSRRALAGLLGAPTPPLLLRGLWFAIVDEADSVFIDEARTPLILSENAGPPADAAVYPQALALAAQLREGEHYTVRAAYQELRLTVAGRRWLTERSLTLGGAWAMVAAREHWMVQALRALRLFHRDQHYIVREGKAQIVDEQTGRVLPGRIWEAGLHQMVEAKECCELSDQARTVARITYQRFFRRYLRLAGMTGTAREVKGEIAAVYGIDTLAIPTHRPSRRRHEGTRAVDTQAEKWRLVADRAAALVAAGRPVLVGTRSVEASEALSAVLLSRGIAHRVLNARQDAEEAELVRTAGETGMLTVATNMAGRGTDIKLPEVVKAAGGLHVVLTEFHESTRIDRQLFGRAARQGDPGSVESIVALDDRLLRNYAGGWLAAAATSPGAVWRRSRWAVGLARRLAQRRAERIHAETRRTSVRHDRSVESMLSFSGRS